MHVLPGKPSYSFVEQDIRGRLQLRNFFKEAREHLTAIGIARNSLEYIYTLFCEQEEVWPSQCERVITYLHALRKPVQAFCDLLDDSADLPPTISTYFFQLVISLNLANEQIQKLISLMAVYRSICRSTSHDAIKQRQTLHLRLGSFVNTSEHVFQKMAHLLDEAHFPDRQALTSRETDSLEAINFNS